MKFKTFKIVHSWSNCTNSPLHKYTCFSIISLTHHNLLNYKRHKRHIYIFFIIWNFDEFYIQYFFCLKMACNTRALGQSIIPNEKTSPPRLKTLQKSKY